MSYTEYNQYMASVTQLPLGAGTLKTVDIKATGMRGIGAGKKSVPLMYYFEYLVDHARYAAVTAIPHDG
jgi:hypothetical protein